MSDLSKIVYLSAAQYETLKTNGSITVGGITINYSNNDLYLTPDTSVPAGGTTGQVLTKASNTDYDTAWTTIERVDDIPLTNNKIVSGGSFQTIDLSKYKRVRCYYRCYSASNANYAADGGIIEMDTTRTPFCAASQTLSYNVYDSGNGWSATNSMEINIAYSPSDHSFSVRMFYNGTLQTTNTEYYIYKMEGIY